MNGARHATLATIARAFVAAIAAVANDRSVRQRVAELQVRLGRFAGRFGHDDKGGSGK